ncbi:MAG: inner membrane-spanning protein YciB [Aestuariivirga sp.]|uniref:inner membrane-spanning protein YciB n=1 Tax=Aestuariivirga sp. TaxID=2650926 RepID=UPI0038D03971
MDKRLSLELFPGPAFLVGNAMGGIFAGAGLGAVATAAAIALRWKWDRRLSLMAMSIFGLTLFLLAAGLFFDNTFFVKVSNTVGSLALAAIVAVGMLLRPSLLQRTLGYSIHLTDQGWRVLHLAWISLSIARGATNELVWRNFSDHTWAIYNGLSDFAWIGLFFLLTHGVARQYWNEPASVAACCEPGRNPLVSPQEAEYRSGILPFTDIRFDPGCERWRRIGNWMRAFCSGSCAIREN